MNLLALARVFGRQKLDGQSLFYFNPHVIFWSCIKSTNNEQNMKMRRTAEEVKLLQLFDGYTSSHSLFLIDDAESF